MSESQTATTDADAQDMIDAWTKLTVDADAAGAVRAAIATAIPDDWTVETNPHISVLPGFEIPAQDADAQLDAFEDDLQEYVGDEFAVNGFHCFHPIEDEDATFVVSLDVDITIDGLRACQETMVETAGGGLHFDPVNTHVTLFKQGDGGDDHRKLTEDERADLKDTLEDAYLPDTIQVVGAGAEQY